MIDRKKIYCFFGSKILSGCKADPSVQNSDEESAIIIKKKDKIVIIRINGDKSIIQSVRRYILNHGQHSLEQKIQYRTTPVHTI